MPYYICVTCGTQFAETPVAPPSCPVCKDERQWVPSDGQRWTILDELRRASGNRIEEIEPGLTGIGTEPPFAIGQRALLIRSRDGNILWDCITLIDDATVSAVQDRGGITAIAISHPHFYSSMIEWSQAFDAPIYLHAADRQWVMRPDRLIRFWEGETLSLGNGLTLIRGGGHFPGGTMLHWAAGANGRGALLSSDIITVVPDRGWVSFMYSYPNLIPLPPTEVRAIIATVEALAFDRIYGAWWERVIRDGGKDAIHRSASRYVEIVEGRGNRRYR